MKIKILMPILMLGLVACGTPTTSPSGTLPSSDSSVPSLISSTPSGTLITDWKANEKQVMTAYIGEVLPVAPFFAESYVFDDQSDYEQFCISDYVGDVADAYGELLVAAGFAFEITEVTEEGYEASYYCKDIEGTNNQYIVEVDYYPELGVAKDGLTEIWGYTAYMWSDEAIEALTIAFDDIIAPLLTEDYEFTSYIDEDTRDLIYVLLDSSKTSKVVEVGAALESGDFSFDGSFVATNGNTYYQYYQRVSDDEILWLQMVFVNDTDGTGMVIFAWVEYSPLPTWSEEADVIIGDVIDIIVANRSVYGEIEYGKDELGTYYAYYDYNEEGLPEIFGDALEAIGFAVEVSGTSNTGIPYISYFYEVSADEDVFVEIQSWPAEGEYAATIFIIIYVVNYLE